MVRSYLNSMKLIYHALLTSNYRVWPWKLSVYLKKKEKRKKRHWKCPKNAMKKAAKNSKKIIQNSLQHEEEINIFGVRIFCYILQVTAHWWWKYFFAIFLIVWKWCPEILYLNLNLTVFLKWITLYEPICQFND